MANPVTSLPCGASFRICTNWSIWLEKIVHAHTATESYANLFIAFSARVVLFLIVTLWRKEIINYCFSWWARNHTDHWMYPVPNWIKLWHSTFWCPTNMILRREKKKKLRVSAGHAYRRSNLGTLTQTPCNHTRHCNCSNYYDHVIGLSIRGAHDTSDKYNNYMVINSIINSWYGSCWVTYSPDIFRSGQCSVPYIFTYLQSEGRLIHKFKLSSWRFRSVSIVTYAQFLFSTPWRYFW